MREKRNFGGMGSSVAVAAMPYSSKADRCQREYGMAATATDARDSQSSPSFLLHCNSSSYLRHRAIRDFNILWFCQNMCLICHSSKQSCKKITFFDLKDRDFFSDLDLLHDLDQLIDLLNLS